ncbi:multidrug resistance protein-like protein [Hortaea werneckii]|nr:multidrug resistance protein-like protein [Hortaea werneckii]KAI6846054.1 multidrug resistance protein-like protein [Hortaea werneckii]KAI6937322.1 multidrug resistance protein-like protein [Hortaea werneckii]KAI6939758.1 multidrug resistance protein-like protein [Hortaea werneckii]KAI6974115.1 multidrug resistance protein-like protein [Hortaea werneckii]
MAELFEDTTFGQILRWASGGRLFAHRDDWDKELREHYIVGSQEKQRRSSDELEKGREDYVLIDFLDDDPKNPRNWTVAKKAFVTFNICLLTFSIYIGSAIYTSGLRDIIQEFAVSQTVATLGLTLYVLGYGMGPMIFAPLSEIPFVGRNKIYLGTLLVFVFFNFGVVYAKNIGMLLVFRFLTGFFGTSLSLRHLGIANVAGPTVGPVVGNWAAEFKGWTWPIWILLWASGFALVFLFFFFPETSANYIICRRTARLRKHEPKDGLNFKCQPEIMGEQMTPTAAMKMTLVKPFTLCFGEPIVFALNLYIALIYAVLYCWLESIPIVFEQVRGFSLGISGLCYIGLIVGGLLTIPPYFYYNYYFVEPRFDDEGNIRPEIRLETALVGCFCLPICLFLFGWTGSDTSIHWIVPIVGTTFFTIGAFCSFAAVLNYLGDSYPADFASISAGNDFFRSCFGAAFPLFATQMFTTLGIDWGNSLLGFLTICFIPIIFGLWWKGDRLRMRSNNARHDI